MGLFENRIWVTVSRQDQSRSHYHLIHHRHDQRSSTNVIFNTAAATHRHTNNIYNEHMRTTYQALEPPTPRPPDHISNPLPLSRPFSSPSTSHAPKSRKNQARRVFSLIFRLVSPTGKKLSNPHRRCRATSVISRLHPT